MHLADVFIQSDLHFFFQLSISPGKVSPRRTYLRLSLTWALLERSTGAAWIWTHNIWAPSILEGFLRGLVWFLTLTVGYIFGFWLFMTKYYRPTVKIKILMMPLSQELLIVGVAPPHLQNGCIGVLLLSFLKCIKLLFVKACGPSGQ